MDLEGLRVERRQNGKGATALVVDLAKAFEKVCWGRAERMGDAAGIGNNGP